MEFSGHILIVPFPLQGHINSMLNLAHLLDLSNFHVTFLLTADTHARLLAHSDVDSGRFSPRFRLHTFPAGIHGDRTGSQEELAEMFYSLVKIGEPFLRELIARTGDSGPPFTCLISDLLEISLNISRDLGLPVYYFRTIGASALWAYFSVPDLIQANELPIKENGMDSLVTKVKGMEGFLRARDLPSLCRADEMTGPVFKLVCTQPQLVHQLHAIILNTFEGLEGPILSHIRAKYPKVYTIGPLHASLKARLQLKQASSNSLLQEDRSCIAWLDSQEPKSVIYVSFGSISVITRQQLMEFWYGLVNSGKKFLWVMRPDLVVAKDGETPIPLELEEGTKANGYMVGWAPQEEVLEHPAVGGFLTHCGWNSTLESIVAGVPMICWPFFADQQTNSRFVGEVWKVGLDMKDVCDRSSVENMIRELMDKRKGELLKRVEDMGKLAKEAITEGGSSYCNLDCLIQDIIKLNVSVRKTI